MLKTFYSSFLSPLLLKPILSSLSLLTDTLLLYLLSSIFSQTSTLLSLRWCCLWWPWMVVVVDCGGWGPNTCLKLIFAPIKLQSLHFWLIFGVAWWSCWAVGVSGGLWVYSDLIAGLWVEGLSIPLIQTLSRLLFCLNEVSFPFSIGTQF